MVSSKKNSKSIIALVVMALLLVASIALAATGAWFTDKADGASSAINFGKIEIALNNFAVTGATDSKVMPGDTLTVAGTVANSQDAAYVGVKVEISTGVGEPQVVYVVKALGNGESINLAESVGTNGAIELTGNDYNNTYQGKPVSITVTAVAVQQANIEITPANTAESYNAIAAYVTANGAVQGPQGA